MTWRGGHVGGNEGALPRTRDFLVNAAKTLAEREESER
jgi:hypothetical protein